MKKIYFLISCTFIIGTISAQTISNGDFETWLATAPMYWSYSTPEVTKSSDAHGGNSAMKILISSDGYDAFSNTGFYIPVSDPKVPPAYYSCWYKLFQVNGENFRVAISMKDASGNIGGTGVGIASTGSSTVYTQLFIPIANPLNKITSSIYAKLDFVSSNKKAGTYVIVDDIGPTSSVGINELKQVNNIEKVYPNPAKERSEIIYSINEKSHVRLFITDITGRIVSELVNENQVSGRYKATISDLPQGTYFCTIQTDSGIQTQKLVITE